MSQWEPAADTQPLSQSPPAPPPSPQTWGWLLPLTPSLPPVSLHLPTYRLGRDSAQADILVTAEHIGEETTGVMVPKLSRVHCSLSLEDGVPSLTDSSMNGTWVGGHRVARGGGCRLEHCATLALLSPDRRLFTFLGAAAMEKQWPSAVTQRFLVAEKVGSGTTAEVRLGYRRTDFSKVALKIIQKNVWTSKYSQPADMRKEVEVLADISHPCIIKVEEVVETEKLFIIVMEFASGGELFDQVLRDEKKKQLSEDTAKFQFYQVVECVRFLHSRQVCHRDLKLENLLLASPGARSLVKVTDFGLAKEWGEDKELESYVGTPVYMAPEVVACQGPNSPSYSSKADCWSLGVILYLLLSGRHPFSSTQTDSMLDRQIREGNIRPMEGGRWQGVSPQAKDLVTALLQNDPEKRLSAEKTLEHSWFRASPTLVAAVVRLMEGGQDQGGGVTREATERNPED